MKQLILLLFVLLFSSCYKKEVQVPVSKTVVTQIPVANVLLKELTTKTDIKIVSLASKELSLQELESNAKLQESFLDSIAPDAQAVVGMRSLLPEDNLYIKVRNRNIKAVEIDLVSSLNEKVSSIGTLKNNPYVWLSVSNLMQMSEIASKDLIALFPEDSAQIHYNHNKLHKELQTLKSEYTKRFLKLPRFETATMDRSFDYLIQDINLFVMKRFKNETEWNKEEKESFEKAIQSGSFPLIIHRWKPLNTITDAADKAGVRFAVLNTGFPAMDHFEKGLIHFTRANLEEIAKKLEEK